MSFDTSNICMGLLAWDVSDALAKNEGTPDAGPDDIEPHLPAFLNAIQAGLDGGAEALPGMEDAAREARAIRVNLDMLDAAIATGNLAPATAGSIMDSARRLLAISQITTPDDAAPARTMQVQVRSVYGEDKVYPADTTARVFASLTGKKTFSARDLANIRELGYEITISAGSIRLPDGFGDATVI